MLLELQADCFAGAWTRDVEEGNSEFFELTLNDLDKAVAGFLELRDGVGTAADDPAAHGTGFDRIGSFVDGYEQGVEHCAGYPDAARRPATSWSSRCPSPSPEDFERGGNLPLAELVPSLLEDLENFWTLLFQRAGPRVDPGHRPRPDRPRRRRGGVRRRDLPRRRARERVLLLRRLRTRIYIDDVNLIPTLNEIGDYAVATEIARQYAFAAQVRLGIEESDLGDQPQRRLPHRRVRVERLPRQPRRTRVRRSSSPPATSTRR